MVKLGQKVLYIAVGRRYCILYIATGEHCKTRTAGTIATGGNGQTRTYGTIATWKMVTLGQKVQ